MSYVTSSYVIHTWGNRNVYGALVGMYACAHAQFIFYFYYFYRNVYGAIVGMYACAHAQFVVHTLNLCVFTLRPVFVCVCVCVCVCVRVCVCVYSIYVYCK